MILSIHQPSYFPWLGLLHKIAASDTYLVMDEVQLTDSAYQHRNLFLSADGKVKYLTIPFSKKGYLEKRFRDLELNDGSWTEKHLNFLHNGYRRHPHYDEIFPSLQLFYARTYHRLFDAVMDSMKLSMQLLGIETKVVFQSELDYDRSLTRGDLVIDLVRASGADCYLSGTGAKAYLDEAAFPRDKTLSYDRFSHPAYSQRNAAEFVPGLSCLDALFNLGVAGAQDLLATTLRP